MRSLTVSTLRWKSYKLLSLAARNSSSRCSTSQRCLLRNTLKSLKSQTPRNQKAWVKILTLQTKVLSTRRNWTSCTSHTSSSGKLLMSSASTFPKESSADKKPWTSFFSPRRSLWYWQLTTWWRIRPSRQSQRAALWLPTSSRTSTGSSLSELAGSWLRCSVSCRENKA